MFVGYLDTKNQKPDAKWWLSAIKRGEDYRKNQAYESDWDTWREYYRSDYSGDVLPVNIIFSVLNSLVPRVYFRNPTVSLSPAVPGMEAQVFARILQRIDNKMLGQMGVKKQMKRMIRDAFMFGTGVGKLGYGGRFSPSITPFVPGKETVEYSFMRMDMPWFQRTAPCDFVVPYGTTFIDDNTRWVAFRHMRQLEDVKADERFDSAARKQVKSTEFIEAGTDLRIPMVALYEVQDRKTGKCFVIQDGGEDLEPLVVYDDLMQQISLFSGFPLIFNENDNTFWGVPDVKILEPYQRELNEINTQIMKHRRLSVAKLLARKKSIDESEVEKMVSEDVGAVIWTNDDPSTSILPTQTSNIPQDLVLQLQNVMMNVREAIGFSRNQAGEFNSRSGDTTATEASIVQRATEIRVDERRDMCADILVDVTAALHEIMYQTLPDEVVTDMAGPLGGIIWVKFKKEMIRKGRYAVQIDPDSAVPQTQEARQQAAQTNYQFLAVNPFIDPYKLTTYLMTEMVGPQFDDMLRMYDPFQLMAEAGVQPGTGASADNPMSVEQYGQVQKTAATQTAAQQLPQLLAPQKG